jgi:stage II sporulation protein D
MRKPVPVKLSLALLPVIFLWGCAPVYFSRPAVKEQGGLTLVRIAIRHNAVQASIKGNDTVMVRDRSHAAAMLPGQSWCMSIGPGGVMISTGSGPLLGPSDGPLRFHSKKPLLFDGAEAKGVLEIRPDSAGGLLVVQECDLEAYLQGVVSAEMGAGRTELEALKAQAVASRSYAYAKIGSRPELGYDLEAGVQHQAYNGGQQASPLITQAVNETRGQVLTWDSKVIAANFHSCCGGRTALPSEVWQASDENFPYLRSDYDRECSISPKFQWSDTIWAGEIVSKLFLTNLNDVKIRSLEILGTGRSGRVLALKVSSTAGDTVLCKDKIRSQLTAPPLYSTRFSIKQFRDGDGFLSYAVLSGYGFGHGVGLCQWGAIGMARKGKGYKSILRHYYHDIRIKKIY